MNECSFYGKIINKEIKESNGVANVKVLLLVEKHRKSKTGLNKVDKSYLYFDAWDSAATTIYSNSEVNDYLLIPNANAKNDGKNISFRINEFKIIPNFENEQQIE